MSRLGGGGDCNLIFGYNFAIYVGIEQPDLKILTFRNTILELRFV